MAGGTPYVMITAVQVSQHQTAFMGRAHSQSLEICAASYTCHSIISTQNHQPAVQLGACRDIEGQAGDMGRC